MIALWMAACTVEPPVPLDVYGAVPAFVLTDSTGAAVTNQSLLGSVWVADFFFTSCQDICPILSAHMAEVVEHYRSTERVRVVSFSVDPGHDTPDVLSGYASRFGADVRRWSFLTGSVDAVKRVVVDGFRQSMDPIAATGTNAATILHGSRVVVVDARGDIRAFPDPAEPGKVELYAVVDRLLSGR